MNKKIIVLFLVFLAIIIGYMIFSPLSGQNVNVDKNNTNLEDNPRASYNTEDKEKIV